MKKAVVLLASLIMFVAMAANAQDSMPSQSDTKSANSGKMAKPPLKNLTGTIGEDGKTFTDEGGKEWTLMNPEAVKGHEGHHVILNAHVYADKDQLHVMKVTMAKAKKGKKKDNM